MKLKLNSFTNYSILKECNKLGHPSFFLFKKVFKITSCEIKIELFYKLLNFKRIQQNNLTEKRHAI